MGALGHLGDVSTALSGLVGSSPQLAQGYTGGQVRGTLEQQHKNALAGEKAALAAYRAAQLALQERKLAQDKELGIKRETDETARADKAIAARDLSDREQRLYNPDYLNYLSSHPALAQSEMEGYRQAHLKVHGEEPPFYPGGALHHGQFSLPTSTPQPPLPVDVPTTRTLPGIGGVPNTGAAASGMGVPPMVPPQAVQGPPERVAMPQPDLEGETQIPPGFIFPEVAPLSPKTQVEIDARRIEIDALRRKLPKELQHLDDEHVMALLDQANAKLKPALTAAQTKAANVAAGERPKQTKISADAQKEAARHNRAAEGHASDLLTQRKTEFNALLPLRLEELQAKVKKAEKGVNDFTPAEKAELAHWDKILYPGTPQKLISGQVTGYKFNHTDAERTQALAGKEAILNAHGASLLGNAPAPAPAGGTAITEAEINDMSRRMANPKATEQYIQAAPPELKAHLQAVRAEVLRRRKSRGAR